MDIQSVMGVGFAMAAVLAVLKIFYVAAKCQMPLHGVFQDIVIGL